MRRRDIAFVDHQVIGRPALDLDGFIEWYQTYADFRFSYVTTNLRVRGRVILTTNVTSGVDPDGGAVVWTSTTRLPSWMSTAEPARVETFDEDQWDAGARPLRRAERRRVRRPRREGGERGDPLVEGVLDLR